MSDRSWIKAAIKNTPVRLIDGRRGVLIRYRAQGKCIVLTRGGQYVRAPISDIEIIPD
jgi:hypothetical protein